MATDEELATVKTAIVERLNEWAAEMARDSLLFQNFRELEHSSAVAQAISLSIIDDTKEKVVFFGDSGAKGLVTQLSISRSGEERDRAASHLFVSKAQIIGNIIGALNAKSLSELKVEGFDRITFPTLLELALAVNAITNENKKIDLSAFKDEGRQLINDMMSREALLRKCVELGGSTKKFNQWVLTELKPTLLSIAYDLDLAMTAGQIERTNFGKILENTTHKE